MSVVISFPSGEDWFKANWVFRQLADDVVRRHPDADILGALEEAQAFNHLDFRTLESGLSARLMSAIRAVAYDTVQGTIEGWRPEDPTGHSMYCDAMSELVSRIDGQVQRAQS